MSEKKTVRLNKLVKEFNVSIDRIFAFLENKVVENLKPNSKVSHEIYMDLLGEFDTEKKAKLSAELLAKEKELARAEEIIKQKEAAEKAKLEEEKKRQEIEQAKTIALEKEAIKENDSMKMGLISNNSIYLKSDSSWFNPGKSKTLTTKQLIKEFTLQLNQDSK